MEQREVVAGIDWQAADRYHDYKRQANQFFIENGPNILFDNMADDVWQWCVDLFTSPKFIVSITFILHNSITL